MTASPCRPHGFVEPDKEDEVSVLRSLARAMLLAKNTEYVPSSALDRMPIFVPAKSTMLCKYDEETILALTDIAVACMLAMNLVNTKHTRLLTPAPEPFSVVPTCIVFVSGCVAQSCPELYPLI